MGHTWLPYFAKTNRLKILNMFKWAKKASSICLDNHIGLI
jgi:hypothetical protein